MPSASSNPLSPRIISASLDRVRGPRSRMPQRCVGAGRVAEGLRADWQRQLRQVKQECGFEYLRMHGLLGDDMGIYREDTTGRPQYNWQYLDEVFDFLLSIGVKPFVEIGFCPGALASGPQTIFWWRGNVTPPKDAQKWQALVRAFVEHVRERYGHAEVRDWYFEVWNEPNLEAFFSGTQSQYFELYALTARAIKAISSEYRVGGPATAGCAWVPELIDYCVKNQVPIDFVSTHDYAVDVGHLDESGTAGTVLSHNPESIYGNVRKVRQQIAESALPELELHFTEWSSSYTPSDPVHDSYHSAPFILDKLKRIGAAADSMSYWVFSDIFEEAGPRFTPFHGGFGLLNYQDLKKPAYFAYQLLNRLGPHELAGGDAASWVTRDDAGAVQVLLWDFTVTNPAGGENNQSYYLRDLPPSREERVKVAVSGLAAGRYTLTRYGVGYRRNDAHAIYRDLGSPSQLTRAQVEHIRGGTTGAALVSEEVTVGADGNFACEVTLRENDVMFLLLRPER